MNIMNIMVSYSQRSCVFSYQHRKIRHKIVLLESPVLRVYFKVLYFGKPVLDRVILLTYILSQVAKYCPPSDCGIGSA